MVFRSFRTMLAIVLIVLLSGCATTRLAPDTVARIKKVGVMSLTAHEFHRNYVGLTVFGNEYEKHDISSWGVDDEYEGQMQYALAALGLFETVRVPYERKELYPVYDLNGPWDAPAFRTPKWSAVEERLKTFADRNSLDAIVMVISVLTEDFLGSSNQHLRGAGLYARGVGNMTAVSVLHLFSTINVIDSKTGKPIATRVLSPTLNVASELSRSKFDDLGAQKIEGLRTMLVDLPKSKWGPTFRAVFTNH